MDYAIQSCDFKRLTNKIIEIPLAAFIFFIASSTIILMVALHFEIKFSTASVAIALAALLITIGSIVRGSVLLKNNKAEKSEKNILLLAAAGALITGLLATSINRPDFDDSIYAAKPVFYLENPQTPINMEVLSIAGLPNESRSIVFQYYEVAQASIAWALGIEYLDVYHRLLPFLVGCLIFLSTYLLLSIFDARNDAALWGTALLIITLLLLGETHRAFGNISIARTFHGKFVFVSAGMFAWIYFSLKYFSLRGNTDWLFLLVFGLALVGLTTTALVYVPILSAVLWLAFIANDRHSTSASIKLGFTYVSTLLPVIVLAIFFSFEAKKYMSGVSTINAGFSESFDGQLGYLINPTYPISIVLFIAASAVVFWKSPFRVFFLVWTFTPIIFLLNPLISGVVIKYITTENIYWRLFYLLPFPLVVPLAAMKLYNRTLRPKILCGLSLLLLMALVKFSPTSVLRAQNGATFDPLSYKMLPSIKEIVFDLRNKLPPGTMLAPLEIATNQVLVTSKFPQFYTRSDYLSFVLAKEHLSDELIYREQAASYLGGADSAPSAKTYTQKLIMRKDGPQYVILNRSISKYNERTSFLAGSGYHEIPDVTSSYSVFTKGQL
jgi:hypothetical protein